MSDWIQDCSVIGGSTSKSIWVEMRGTDGTAKTGLVYSDITATYTRPGGSNTSVTMATLASITASYSSGGFKEVTNGAYRFDVPDAAIATLSGGGPVLFTFAATGALATNFQLIVNTNNNSASNATQWAGVNVTGMPMPTYTQPAGFLAATFPATLASTTNITGGTITTVTNLTNAPTAGDFTATMKTSLNAATPTVTFANGAVRTDIGMASANLDSQLAGIEAGIGGSGLTGPYTVSLSFVDANNTAVPLVDFAVVGQGLARANVNGVISFGLNAGTFAIVARPTSSVVFPNVSITVTSAGVTQVIAGTAILVPTPGGSTPSM